MPPLPQPMGAPYLGQQYVAASLLADGHRVRVLDLAAPLHSPDFERAVAEAESFGPDMIGMTLFTYNAAVGYRLAKRLAGRTRLLVAGGPHATVCPGEPARHGFDVSVSGEGEQVIVALARALDSGGDLATIPNVTTSAGRAGPSGASIADLDALVYPLESYPCYDMSGYHADGRTVAPGGLMTSRGCPARCTFCANYVTGRAYRYRSASNVLEEMRQLRARHQVWHFPFWDDAFTAYRPRLNELCDALMKDPVLSGSTWTCITPGNMVKPFDLRRMRRAGCTAINFGIESGDYNILRVIQKGQRPEHVLAAVRAAKDEGMITIVNFMFGFPQEGVQELARTRELMEALAPHTDYFNHRGVLVPFPGTAIYDANHERYGFTDWWLDEGMIPDEPRMAGLRTDEQQRLLERDPTLELDFFGYSADVVDGIEACVRFKAQHNQTAIARLTGSSS